MLVQQVFLSSWASYTGLVTKCHLTKRTIFELCATHNTAQHLARVDPNPDVNPPFTVLTKLLHLEEEENGLTSCTE